MVDSNIYDDTLRRIDEVNPKSFDRPFDRIYACRKVLMMVKVAKAAFGNSMELAEREFHATWLLRCSEKALERERSQQLKNEGS